MDHRLCFTRPTYLLGEAVAFDPNMSKGGAFRHQAAEELDAKCQLVEAETEFDQNAYFGGVQETLSGRCEVMNRGSWKAWHSQCVMKVLDRRSRPPQLT